METPRNGKLNSRGTRRSVAEGSGELSALSKAALGEKGVPSSGPGGPQGRGRGSSFCHLLLLSAGCQGGSF